MFYDSCTSKRREPSQYLQRHPNLVKDALICSCFAKPCHTLWCLKLLSCQKCERDWKGQQIPEADRSDRYQTEGSNPEFESKCRKTIGKTSVKCSFRVGCHSSEPQNASSASQRWASCHAKSGIASLNADAESYPELPPSASASLQQGAASFASRLHKLFHVAACCVDTSIYPLETVKHAGICRVDNMIQNSWRLLEPLAAT